jgi:hypothetical protein
MKREPRYPVTINGEALRAIFTRPKPSDTRGFFVRLLSSVQPIVKFTKRGISFIGIRGGADF